MKKDDPAASGVPVAGPVSSDEVRESAASVDAAAADETGKGAEAKRRRPWEDYVGDLNFYMLFWVFMIGNLIGFVVEGFECIYRFGEWQNHVGVLWGPFCIIYGFGSVVIYTASHLMKSRPIWLQFIIFAVAGGLVEYFGSLFQEVFFGAETWNYQYEPDHIGSRVTVRMAIEWGILGIAVALLIYPLFKKLLRKMNNLPCFIITWVLVVFMAVDLTATCIAVYRWGERQVGHEPKTKIGAFFDEHYGDERMQSIFVNMNFNPKHEQNGE